MSQCKHLPGYENLTVLGARLIVKPTPPEEVTKSGIIIAHNAQEPKYEGTVVVTGPGARLDNGVKMPMEVEVGQKVIYSRLAGVPINVEIGGKKEDLLVINERDIIAIIE
jgi:chaperonin GroES